jgi:hypothetical protein
MLYKIDDLKRLDFLNNFYEKTGGAPFWIESHKSNSKWCYKLSLQKWKSSRVIFVSVLDKGTWINLGNFKQGLIHQKDVPVDQTTQPLVKPINWLLTQATWHKWDSPQIAIAQTQVSLYHEGKCISCSKKLEESDMSKGVCEDCLLYSEINNPQ